MVLKISSTPSASVRNTWIITGMSFSGEPKQITAQLFEELITRDLLDKPPSMQWITQLVILVFWIAIYPVDSAIKRLNYRA